MRTGSMWLSGLILLVAAGCALEQRAGFEPGSGATHVTGTLAKKDDMRPVDGPLWLTVKFGIRQEERVMIPSLFTGQPPSEETIALQQKAEQLKIGDRLTVHGTRSAGGLMTAERIDILEP